MKRILLALLTSALAGTVVVAGTASASGPARPGQEAIEVQCEGLGTITVAVPRNEHHKGAGQIVGQRGQGIPVSTNFTLTDVTTEQVLFSEAQTIGGGNAHPNQSTITCKAINAEVPASIFFGEHELPPGVEPGDIIRAEIEVQVILKP